MSDATASIAALIFLSLCGFFWYIFYAISRMLELLNLIVKNDLSQVDHANMRFKHLLDVLVCVKENAEEIRKLGEKD